MSVDKYKFSSDLLKQSAGNFKTFVKSRYKDISDSDLSGLVEKYYGKDGNGSKSKEKPSSATK